MNRIMKRVVGVSAGALAVTSLVVLSATSASAASSSNGNAAQCTTVTNLGTFPASTTPTYTVALSAADPVAGNPVTVTGSYSPALTNGPIALTNYVSKQRVTVKYRVNGGSYTTAVGSYGSSSSAVSVAANGTLPNIAPGSITFTPSVSAGDTIDILPVGFEQNLTAVAFGSIPVNGDTGCLPIAADQPTNLLTLTAL